MDPSHWGFEHVQVSSMKNQTPLPPIPNQVKSSLYLPFLSSGQKPLFSISIFLFLIHLSFSANLVCSLCHSTKKKKTLMKVTNDC